MLFEKEEQLTSVPPKYKIVFLGGLLYVPCCHLQFLLFFSGVSIERLSPDLWWQQPPDVCRNVCVPSFCVSVIFCAKWMLGSLAAKGYQNLAASSHH